MFISFVEWAKSKDGKGKKTPLVHHDLDTWLTSVDNLKKELNKLKDTLDSKKELNKLKDTLDSKKIKPDEKEPLEKDKEVSSKEPKKPDEKKSLEKDKEVDDKEDISSDKSIGDFRDFLNRHLSKSEISSKSQDGIKSAR